jgi:PAS domain S-box-containing protein
MSVESQKLIERIPFPASLTDGRNRFVAINSAHRKLYGWSNDDLVGQSPTKVMAGGVRKALLEKIFVESGADGWHGKVANVDRDGRNFEVILNTRPVWLGKRKLKLGVACLPGEEHALIRSLLDLAWINGKKAGRQLDNAPLDRLTPREVEVFGLLGRGLRTAEIADRMDVSFNTARVYAAAIRRKLNCPNIETLRALAARHSWGFD